MAWRDALIWRCRALGEFLAPVATALSGMVRARASLTLELVVLRQQIAVLQRTAGRPAIRNRDRWFWIAMCRWWPDWRQKVQVVAPATVVRWHRAGFRAYWRRRSRPKGGRPMVHRSIRRLTQRMAIENPTWGAPRIHAELMKLGLDVSERTVSRTILKLRKPSGTPRQRCAWRTFLKNHAPDVCAMDFLVVPTPTFRCLFVWFVIEHGSRRVIEVGVTEQPTAIWVANKLRQAFPWDSAPKYLVSDNDPVFKSVADQTSQSMGIRSIRITPRCPWQNGVAERWVGTLRRELLDHVVPLGPRHLERLVREYVAY